MNAKKSPSTSLAPIAPPTAAGDELAGYADQGLDLEGNDGLGETDAQDFRIPSRTLNMKGLGPDGRSIPKDMWYDTLAETLSPEIAAVFIDLHKRNVWSEWNQGEGRSQIICRSDDRVTGTMSDSGERRPCKGCPDAQWQTLPNGKRGVHCGPVYDVFALDRATLQPFVVRFKRTSLPVIRQHLQRHHLGVRRTPRGMANYPLYAFEVRMTTVMSTDGNYASPVLTRGVVLSVEDMKTAQVTAQSLREYVLPRLAQLDTEDADAGAGAGSFEYGANAAGPGGAASIDDDDDTKPLDGAA